MKELIQQIEKDKIFAIVRGIEPEKMAYLFEALLSGGIKHVEITLNTKGAYQEIKHMNKIFGSDMIIGAGTVLNEEMASKATEAGAKFLVSPNIDRKMIENAIANGVLPIPGAMTPTEIVKAINYGAKIIKLFPSSSLGPRYIRELRGPLDDLKLIAVGGISKENAGDYIKAGAIGVGIGSSLVNKSAINSSNFDAITEYAMELNASIENN